MVLGRSICGLKCKCFSQLIQRSEYLLITWAVNIFEGEFWTFSFSSAFQSGDSVACTMEQAENTVPLESEPNTDNMENSSPGKNSSLAVENVLVCHVCICITCA